MKAGFLRVSEVILNGFVVALYEVRAKNPDTDQVEVRPYFKMIIRRVGEVQALETHYVGIEIKSDSEGKQVLAWRSLAEVKTAMLLQKGEVA